MIRDLFGVMWFEESVIDNIEVCSSLCIKFVLDSHIMCKSFMKPSCQLTLQLCYDPIFTNVQAQTSKHVSCEIFLFMASCFAIKTKVKTLQTR